MPHRCGIVAHSSSPLRANLVRSCSGRSRVAPGEQDQACRPRRPPCVTFTRVAAQASAPVSASVTGARMLHRIGAAAARVARERLVSLPDRHRDGVGRRCRARAPPARAREPCADATSTRSPSAMPSRSAVCGLISTQLLHIAVVSGSGSSCSHGRCASEPSRSACDAYGRKWNGYCAARRRRTARCAPGRRRDAAARAGAAAAGRPLRGGRRGLPAPAASPRRSATAAADSAAASAAARRRAARRASRACRRAAASPAGHGRHGAAAPDSGTDSTHDSRNE